jgi:hypothetical protein
MARDRAAHRQNDGNAQGSKRPCPAKSHDSEFPLLTVGVGRLFMSTTSLNQ